MRDKGRNVIQELTRKSTGPSGRTRSLVLNPPWHGLALAAVLALSAFLNLFRITQESYGNAYYAATVKNMLVSCHRLLLRLLRRGLRVRG
jgi:hypothetical protein